jgi:predicted metallopeptidase
MESLRHDFDFTTAMCRLCADISARLSEFQHIDVERIAFNICQTRRDVSHGMYASLTPLRFTGGAERRTVRGVSWAVEQICDEAGREYLYLLSFYLPRFQNSSLEEKLTTVFHELWHIAPEFNGDVRRHGGRCYAHGPSQQNYDARMMRLAQAWLACNPPHHLYDFLSLNFAELVAEHGRVLGTRWRTPRLVRR